MGYETVPHESRSGLNCLSAWERFGTTSKVTAEMVEQALSQLPFGLGTIRDGQEPRFGMERRRVSIAFRLGNDSGQAVEFVKSKPRSWMSQLPFGLGTIRDKKETMKCEKLIVPSQLPFGLGTIRDFEKWNWIKQGKRV